MAITGRAEQLEQDRFPGVHRSSMTGIETGCRVLMVGDIIFDPGSEAPYHRHPNAEESRLLIEGGLECSLDGYWFTIKARDSVFAATGVPHGFRNLSGEPARMITALPDVRPVQLFVPAFEEPKAGALPSSVVRGSDVRPFEQCPGVTRSDLVGKDQGATSTSIARLDFSPETTTLPHYHPETEESMFCLSGELQAVYGRGAHILYAGDMFTAEPGVRHGISNPSGAPSVLPAIHPTTAPVSVLTHQ